MATGELGVANDIVELYFGDPIFQCKIGTIEDLSEYILVNKLPWRENIFRGDIRHIAIWIKNINHCGSPGYSSILNYVTDQDLIQKYIYPVAYNNVIGSLSGNNINFKILCRYLRHTNIVKFLQHYGIDINKMLFDGDYFLAIMFRQWSIDTLNNLRWYLSMGISIFGKYGELIEFQVGIYKLEVYLELLDYFKNSPMIGRIIAKYKPNANDVFEGKYGIMSIDKIIELINKNNLEWSDVTNYVGNKLESYKYVRLDNYEREKLKLAFGKYLIGGRINLVRMWIDSGEDHNGNWLDYVLEQIIKYDIDVNLVTDNGSYFIQYFIQFGKFKEASILIDYGALLFDDNGSLLKGNCGYNLYSYAPKYECNLMEHKKQIDEFVEKYKIWMWNKQVIADGFI